jgi:hypothetical protein
MFDRIHFLGRIHYSFGQFIGEFGQFISKIGRYSSLGDFTVHIFNQMDFNRFFRKPMGSEEADFLISASFLNTAWYRVAIFFHFFQWFINRFLFFVTRIGDISPGHGHDGLDHGFVSHWLLVVRVAIDGFAPVAGSLHLWTFQGQATRWQGSL